jgi:hypothetical protein
VGYNKIKAFVPYPVVKDVLSQQDCLGSRRNFVSKIQEYDLEIKQSKIIECQGLAKMLIESNQEAINMGEREQINFMVNKIENDEWYSYIIYYLNNLLALIIWLIIKGDP